MPSVEIKQLQKLQNLDVVLGENREANSAKFENITQDMLAHRYNALKNNILNSLSPSDPQFARTATVLAAPFSEQPITPRGCEDVSLQDTPVSLRSNTTFVPLLHHYKNTSTHFILKGGKKQDKQSSSLSPNQQSAKSEHEVCPTNERDTTSQANHCETSYVQRGNSYAASSKAFAITSTTFNQVYHDHVDLVPPCLFSKDTVQTTSLREDTKKEKAVRDYLRRMNILGWDIVAGGTDTSLNLFNDALFNGCALCQLTSCLFVERDERVAKGDPIACRQPCLIEEVRLNYIASIRIMSEVPDCANVAPPHLLCFTPEDVYHHGRISTLLDLYVHLIAVHLPSPERLPSSPPELSWQTPADARKYAPEDASLLWKAERHACAFLFTSGVLPEPQFYGLPEDNCLIPGPLAAPSIPHYYSTHFVARATKPAALYVPSVFPYLCNGLALVRLSRRVCAGTSRPPLSHSDRPRTPAGCMDRLHAALCGLQTIVGVLPGHPTGLVRDIYAGCRRSVVLLLAAVANALGHKIGATPPQARRSAPRNPTSTGERFRGRKARAKGSEQKGLPSVPDKGMVSLKKKR